MRFILPILLSLMAFPASARCIGENLVETLKPGEKAALQTAITQHPYPQGNMWKAQKDDSTIHLVGTLHLDDPRLTTYLAPIWSIIDTADLILLEGDEKAMQELRQEMSTNLSLMFITDGPTLPDRLTDDEWQHLSTEMAARGMPSFMVSKMRPWYVSMMLALPPCALAGMKTPNGVDQRIIRRATDQNIPTGSLEPYDTLFSLFGSQNSQDELDMIRMSLANSQIGDAMIRTTIDSYLSGDHRAIWEFSRIQTYKTTDMPTEKITEMFLEMEAIMLTDRNVSWMDVILPAAGENRNIVIAAGAAHLSGKKGLLYLLEQQGYAITRIDGF